MGDIISPDMASPQCLFGTMLRSYHEPTFAVKNVDDRVCIGLTNLPTMYSYVTGTLLKHSPSLSHTDSDNT
jgi:hypothetical protein